MVNVKQSTGGKLFDFGNHVFLIFFCLTILYPFWTIVIQSFAPIDEVNKLGLHVWLDTWSLNGWRYVLDNADVGIAYFNTVFRVVVGTIITLIVTFTGAYALSKRTLPGRNVFTALYVFTMFFSGGLIPTYLLVKNLGLINTRMALILPVAINAYYIIIARNFLMTIDQALEDSAVIDGASYWVILFRIIVPIAKPVIATIGLWAAVQHWNEWFLALIYTSEKNLRVLQLLIREMIQNVQVSDLDEFIEDLQFKEKIPPQSVQAATILITIGPIVLLYPFVQKYFIKGIMIGSLKG